MKYFGEGLSEKHKELNSIIRKKDYVHEAKKIFLEIHASLHLSKVSGTDRNEVDALTEDLQDEEYTVMPTIKDETMAWAFWHIARMEDLTMNILVAGQEQVFDSAWKLRMNATILDMGNALNDEEILRLSKSLHIQELLNYRNSADASHTPCNAPPQ